MRDIKALLEAELDRLDLPGLVANLVAIPSHHGVEGQETACALYLKDYFDQAGLKPSLHEAAEGRFNIVTTLKGAGGGKSLLLTTHLDTVPPHAMAEPYRARIEEGYLYGLGAVDAKGPLACMTAAVVALKKSGVTLEGDLVFAGVIDEERCSAGSTTLIRDGFRPDAAIVGEPTGMELCLGHRGLAWLEVVFSGRTVHGGSQDEVLNTISMASRFIDRVEKKLVPALFRRKDPLVGSASLNFGLIRAGSQPSTVPGECILQLDRRWLPGEDLDVVIGELQQILDRLREEDSRFLGRASLMPSGMMENGWVQRPSTLDKKHPLAMAAALAVQETTGKEPACRAFTAWSDAGVLSGYGGIPTLLLAPGELACAHSPSERIEIGSLRPAALAYALLAARFFS